MAHPVRNAATALVTVQVLFGILPVAAQAVLPETGPWALLALRTVGAAAVLWSLQRLLATRRVRLREDGLKVAGLALLGVVFNQGLFILGLQYTTAINAALLITTIPVFTYAIAVVTGREALGPRRAAGILLALLGALYVIGLSGYEAGAEHVLGDILVVTNCVSFAAFLVFSKPYTERYDPLSLTAWVFVFGSLVFLPIGFATGLADIVPALPTRVWWTLLFIVLGPSVLTYLLNAVALRQVPSSTVAVFIYLQPITTSIAAYLWLGDLPSPRLAPAALLVFAGIWLVSRKGARGLRGRVVGS